VNPWIRKNGDFSLIVCSGFDRDGTPYGIPYGSFPRLVLAYIITQDHQLVEKWLRNRGKVPSLGGETRGFYLMLGPRELSAAYRYTTLPFPFPEFDFRKATTGASLVHVKVVLRVLTSFKSFPKAFR